MQTQILKNRTGENAILKPLICSRYTQLHQNRINYLNSSTRCTFLYVFIPQLLYILHVSNDYFVHHHESTSYSICSSVHTILECVTAQPHVYREAEHGMYRAENTVTCGLLMMKEKVVRNM